MSIDDPFALASASQAQPLGVVVPFGPCLLWPSPYGDREWVIGRWTGAEWCDSEGLVFTPQAWASLPPPPACEDRAAGQTGRTHELRVRAEALAAEYKTPLAAGEAGLIEAERRQRELERRISALSREFESSAAEEEQILAPLEARENELWDIVGERIPESLAGVAVKLRWLSGHEAGSDSRKSAVLQQCLEVIDRMAPGSQHSVPDTAKWQ